ncbi:phosphotransferase [Adonisia turfae]|uniref:Aminoglycoside phosphotransferase family protein n=1 Tax=Adonisia turfae CCMR0081 TaxID=2292702 RepID=A0A6M0RNY7_9CYAN|nr:phosphotransferase [Adonisia turfae]NEZ57600.1 aminoglycoside phosphotransferase family protein [Adonisia turfae CCMR0081]
MTFRLNAQNVFDYLQGTDLWSEPESPIGQVELKPAKNFNLLVSLNNGKKFLVKQERYAQNGKTVGEFFNEWHIRKFWQTFPEFAAAQPTVSNLVHFDADHAIAVFDYLDDYRDLGDFYAKENHYPEQISKAIGQTIATLHKATFCKAEHQSFLTHEAAANSTQQPYLQNLERPTPEIFGSLPGDGIRFFVLYQRFESLSQEIAATNAQVTPCCLIHNDLKLNNILLCPERLRSSSTDSADFAELPDLIRLIDWERAGWGDPAFDLGSVIASYLQLWLGSLVVSQDMAIEESLKLAMTPLELLQPSLHALVKAYFDEFPEILAQRPDFLSLTLKLAGIVMIFQIQSVLQYQKTFGNNQICTLQVAKSLLCQPELAIPTLFGTDSLQVPTLSTVM